MAQINTPPSPSSSGGDVYADPNGQAGATRGGSLDSETGVGMSRRYSASSASNHLEASTSAPIVIKVVRSEIDFGGVKAGEASVTCRTEDLSRRESQGPRNFAPVGNDQAMNRSLAQQPQRFAGSNQLAFGDHRLSVIDDNRSVPPNQGRAGSQDVDALGANNALLVGDDNGIAGAGFNVNVRQREVAKDRLQTLRNHTIADWREGCAVGGLFAGGGFGLMSAGAAILGGVLAGATTVAAIAFTGGIALGGALLVGGIGWAIGSKIGKSKADKKYGPEANVQPRNAQRANILPRNLQRAENLPRILPDEYQGEIIRTVADMATFADHIGVNLTSRRDEQFETMRKSMEELVLDRRAMFGNDYTVGEAGDDLREFGKAMVKSFGDLDSIQRCYDEGEKNRLETEKKHLWSDVSNRAETSFRAYVGNHEAALARAQSEWCADSDTMLSLVEAEKRTPQMARTFQNVAFIDYGNDRTEELAEDYKSNPGHVLRRLHARMDRLAKEADANHAPSVKRVCEQQRGTCEGAAAAMWLALTGEKDEDNVPPLKLNGKVDNGSMESDKDVIRATNSLAAFNAAFDLYSF